MEKEIQVVNNEQLMRFESPVGEEMAELVYRWYHGNLALMHTFVPEEGRGQGYSAALAKYALEFAKSRGVKVKVYCTYVGSYLKRHSEYQDLVIK